MVYVLVLAALSLLLVITYVLRETPVRGHLDPAARTRRRRSLPFHRSRRADPTSDEDLVDAQQRR